MRKARQSKKTRADYSIDSILAQSLTPHRIALIKQTYAGGGKNPFTIDQFTQAVNDMIRSLPEPLHALTELDNIYSALDTGQAQSTPNLARPEMQLLWGAALLHIHTNIEAYSEKWNRSPLVKTLSDVPVWKQIVGSQRARQELLHMAYHAAEGVRRPDTRFAWGKPGSMFYFNPEANAINMDLMMTLMVGFEHSRAILLHEVSHSQLTTQFPKRQREIREEMQKIKEQQKQRGGKLLPEEYKKLRLLSAEWQLRHRLFDAAENNCVNRNVSNMGKIMAQDYGYSNNQAISCLSESGLFASRLNELRKDALSIREAFNKAAMGDESVLDALLAKHGVPASPETRQAMMQMLARDAALLDYAENLDRPVQDEPQTASIAFDNIIRAVAMAYFQQNWLTTNDLAGWHKLNIIPEWVRRFANDNLPPGTQGLAVSYPDYAYLMELCSGPQGLEHLQPTLRDRWYGAQYYNHLIDTMATRRTEVMDKIWDEFLDPYFQEMIKEVEEKVDQQIEEQKKKQEQQQQEGQDGQEGDGQDGQDGQDGDGQDGQDGQSGQGGKKGKKGKKGQKGKDGQQGDGQDGEPGEGDGQKGDKKEKGNKGKQKGGPGEGGEEFDPTQAGLSKDGKKTDVDFGEGTEEMPDVDMPPESPQGNESKPGQDGQDGQDGQGKGKTVQEMLDDMQKNDGPPEDGEGQDGDGEGQGDGEGDPSESDKEVNDGSPSKGAGKGGRPKTLEEIAKQEWVDYPSVVAQLATPISQVARVLKKIQERQKETKIKRARQLEKLPESNEMDRLSLQAHGDLVLKSKTGQKIEDRDLNRFQKDKIVEKPTKPDIVILIDGSGSMTDGNHGPHATALDIATLSATILTEAARRIDANVYIAMWGNNTPVMIARPGDDMQTVGRRIVSARDGLNCGTSLAPSIQSIVNEMAAPKSKASRFSGYTHILILSDGDITDFNDAEKAINALLSTSKFVTLDFGIIKAQSLSRNKMLSRMEELAQKAQQNNAAHRIGVVVDNNANTMPVSIVGLVLEKIRQSQSFTAVERGQKIKSFRRAKAKMNADLPSMKNS